MAGIQGRQAELAGPTAGTESQQYLIDALRRRMEGGAPSVAEQQLQQATERNVQGVMGAAGSMRGGANPALLQRQALQTAGAVNQEAAGQGAVLRAGEQAQAEQAMQAAAATQQQVETQRAALIQGYQAQGLSLEQAQFQANQRLTEMQADLVMREQEIAAGIAGQESQAAGQQAGAVASGLGSAAALMLMSDERKKTAVKKGDEGVKGFLRSITAKEFQYKSDAPDSRRIGVMAQDVEKSALGRQLVRKTKTGTKFIDGAQAVGAALAAAANLNQRLEQVEAR